ncbi:MFS transporter [Radicibacter daui]|uniref:MFS transporter n=1 Tax=Radicibacter daui TaxID=3064829 RepID=UPI0040469E0A
MQDFEHTASTGWKEAFTGRTGLYTLVLDGGTAIHAVSLFLVSAALPSVVADIGGIALYSWTSLLFVVSSIVGASSAGLLKQRAGSRNAYCLAALVMLSGTLTCALSPNMAVFLTGRFFQGLGGGAIGALAYALLRTLFPPRLWPHQMALLSAVWGAAALVGPAFGGGFADLWSWRGAFLTEVAATLLFLALASRLLPSGDGEPGTGRLPWRRLLLLSLAILVCGLSANMPSLPTAIACVAAAILLLALTLRRDGQSAGSRLFPTGALSPMSAVGSGNCIVLLMSMATAINNLYTPLMVETLYGVPAVVGGYITALQALGWTVVALLITRASPRGVRLLLAIGPPVTALSSLSIAGLLVSGPLWLLAVAIAGNGIGMGLFFSHLTNITLAAARPGEESVTGSAIKVMQFLGAAFGAAISGLIANAAGLGEGISVASASHVGPLLFGGFALAPALAALLAWIKISRPAEVAPQE